MDKQPKNVSYIDDYQIIGCLGEGGQANVYLCGKDNILYAAKVYTEAKYKQEACQNQALIMSKLKHPNITNIISWNIKAKIKQKGQDKQIAPVMILEYAQGGDLFDYVKYGRGFSAQICRSIAKTLIQTIKYLHSVGFTHRDLKLENILFDKDYNLKISDFGLSTTVKDIKGSEQIYDSVGTPGYRAPEVEKGSYKGLDADIFAIGVIIFFMYCRFPPFPSTLSSDKYYGLIQKGEFNNFWSLHEQNKNIPKFTDSFKRLMNSFFSYKIQNRPSLESLRQDEWLNEDQALQQDIKKELESRYTKMLERDQNKRKIEKKKVKFFQSQQKKQREKLQKQKEKNQKIQEQHQQIIQQKQENLQEQEQQKISPESRSTGKIITHFHDIVAQDLPLSNKYNLVATKVTPSVLVAWIQQYVQNALKNKNTFLNDSYPNIEIKNYKTNYNKENKSIKVSLYYTITLNFHSQLQQEQEQTQIQQLVVQGQLVRLQNGQISIDWKKKHGNDIWLSQMIYDLNAQIKVLR